MSDAAKEPFYADMLVTHKRYLEAEARRRGISVRRTLEEILDEYQEMLSHRSSISSRDKNRLLQ